MQLNWIKRTHSNKNGFTLIDIVVTLFITSIIGIGVTSTTIQIFNINSFANSHLIAVKQVETAINTINRDAYMAQSVQIDQLNNFTFTFGWTEWNNTKHTVNYSISAQGNKLIRSEIINTSQPVITTVANYINSNPSMTNCTLDTGSLPEVFKFTLSVTVTGFKSATETRTCQVTPILAR